MLFSVILFYVVKTINILTNYQKHTLNDLAYKNHFMPGHCEVILRIFTGHIPAET